MREKGRGGRDWKYELACDLLRKPSALSRRLDAMAKEGIEEAEAKALLQEATLEVYAERGIRRANWAMLGGGLLALLGIGVTAYSLLGEKGGRLVIWYGAIIVGIGQFSVALNRRSYWVGKMRRAAAGPRRR